MNALQGVSRPRFALTVMAAAITLCLAQPYTFTHIADSVSLNLDPFDTDRPSINSAAQIAFIASLEAGRRGIYRADPVVQWPADLTGNWPIGFSDYLEFFNLYDAEC